MSFILALFRKAGDFFASPHLPLDSDYSYQARHRETQRMLRQRLALVAMIGR